MLLAIDPGTNSLGWALFSESGGFLDAGSIQPIKNGLDRKARTLSIISKLHDKSYRLRTELGEEISTIALEEPMLRGLSNNAMQRILGMIELIFKDIKINYYSPMSVKASMGSGKFDKKDMYEALSSELKSTKIVAGLINDHDAIDAICIGLTHFKKETGRVNNDSSKLSNSSKKTSKKGKGKGKSRVRSCKKRTSTHKKKRK